MKKILFFLLLSNTVFAQTDSTRVDSLKTVNMQDVTITAAGLVRADNKTPSAFINISRTELQKNNLGQDLPILLDNTPSVVTTSDAGAGVGYTGIRIRGSDATRVNVTLNGVPVNDAESQAVFWVNTPDMVSSAQSIQIQRGVGTSTNGSASFGGQLSLQTLDASPKPYVEAGVSVGSFNTFRVNVRGGNGLIKNHFFVDAAGSWISSDGYIDRGSSNLRSWFAQAGYKWNTGTLKLLYFGGREKTYQAWYGVPQDSLKTNRTFNIAGTDYFSKNPPYENETDNYGQDYMQLHYHHLFPRQNLRVNAAAFATLGKGYYEQYKAGADIQNYFEDLPSVETDLVRQRWLDNIYYGGVFSLSYQHDKVSATVGGLYSRYDGDHFGRVVWADNFSALDKNRHYYDGHSLKTDANVYARFNYALLYKVNFYADLQYRYVNYKTNGVDNDKLVYDVARQWHFFNPKAGLLYEVNQRHHVYASYAMGNREPNRDDVLAAVASAKEVKPESMHDIEAGYKFLHHRFPFSINYYMMYYKDQLVLTGKLNDVGALLKENVPVSYRTGIELNGGVNFTRKKKVGSVRDSEPPMNLYDVREVFGIRYSFTYSLNRIQSFDEYIYTYDEHYSPVDSLTQIITHKNTAISFSPDIIASLELVAYPVKGLEISLMNKAVSKQYLDNTANEERKLNAFFYSNLRLSYQLPLKREDKEIKFTLLFNNIFHRLFESNGYTFSERYSYLDENNNVQVTPTYTYNYYYPQAGFNMLAGVNVRF